MYTRGLFQLAAQLPSKLGLVTELPVPQGLGWTAWLPATAFGVQVLRQILPVYWMASVEPPVTARFRSGAGTEALFRLVTCLVIFRLKILNYFGLY